VLWIRIDPDFLLTESLLSSRGIFFCPENKYKREKNLILEEERNIGSSIVEQVFLILCEWDARISISEHIITLALSKQKPYITGANLVRQRKPFLYEYQSNLYCIKIIPIIKILPIHVHDKEKGTENHIIRSDTVHYIP
jgi:hypothetical protein